MILHGNARGGGRDLAAHLMKPENERIEIIEMRGFASDNLKDALVESYAISKGTRCKQHLFSLSINPPANREFSDEEYKSAADRVAKELGLSDQPRAIVRHWKRGDDGVLRQHAHAVWCRIDVEKMRAIPLPFSKLRLREISRELHIRHNIKMPPGLINSKHRDPRNFTLEQWQQCKRAKKDIRQLQSDFRDAWAISDSPVAFAHALRERGYILAKGNKGYVAVDHKGEVFAVRTYVGINPKEVRAKLGEPENLPDVVAAQAQAAQQVTKRLLELRAEQRDEITAKRSYARIQHKRLAALQERENARLQDMQARRHQIEEQVRQSRLRTGLPGFWDWLTGKKKQTLALNRNEETQSRKRNRDEFRAQRDAQLRAQKSQQDKARTERLKNFEAIKELRGDLARLKEPPDMKQEKLSRSRKSERPRRRSRNRDGPSLER